jgi:hypothetical protein
MQFREIMHQRKFPAIWYANINFFYKGRGGVNRFDIVAGFAQVSP